MAAGHTVDDDGKLYTITLRDGLAFHDGDPCQRARLPGLDPALVKACRVGSGIALATEEIKALTIYAEIRLKRPFALTLRRWLRVTVSSCRNGWR